MGKRRRNKSQKTQKAGLGMVGKTFKVGKTTQGLVLSRSLPSLGEVKFFDSNYTTALDLTSTGTVCSYNTCPFFTPASGTAFNQRIGNKVNIVSCHFQWVVTGMQLDFQGISTFDECQPPFLARMSLIKARDQPNVYDYDSVYEAVFPPTTTAQAMNNINCYRKVTASENVDVLKTKVQKIGFCYSSVASVTPSMPTDNAMARGEFYQRFKPVLNVRFGNAAAAEPVVNAMGFVFAISRLANGITTQNSDPHLYATWRIAYVDA
jgi:hypothetical protein